MISDGVKSAFIARHLEVKNSAEISAELVSAITLSGLVDYAISILFRLTPVIVFAFVLGALLGKGELLSISVSAAFASFLLCWPLILNWDQLVNERWSHF